MSDNVVFKDAEKIPTFTWKDLDGKKGVMRFAYEPPIDNHPGVRQLYFFCEDVTYLLAEEFEPAKSEGK